MLFNRTVCENIVLADPSMSMERVMHAVPADGDIKVAAVVANQDVGVVDLGQPAEIKIDTFPFTRYGLIHGRVDGIAHDAVDEPQSDQQRR